MEYENNIWKYCGLHDVKYFISIALQKKKKKYIYIYFISIGETSCKWYMNNYMTNKTTRMNKNESKSKIL